MHNNSDTTTKKADVYRLALPLASVMLGETLMGIVDTKLVGELGPGALAGVGLANAALYLSTISMLGLMRSVKVCTAHAIGRGRADHGIVYAQVGIGMGFLAGAAFALALHLTALFLASIVAPSDLLVAAQVYLRARSWGLPAACALTALMEYRQGKGEMRTSLCVGLGGNLLNAMLAYGLTYGWAGYKGYGLPALGVQGTGLGTTLTQYLQWLVLGVVVAYRDRSRWHPPQQRLSYFVALRELLTVGIPTALHCGFEYLAFASCTALLSSMGSLHVAAHQIAVVINRLSYLPGLAIGEVACILVSGALGARQLADADRAVRAALTTAVMFMVGCGIILALFGPVLAAFFTADTAMAALTARILRVAGLFQVLDAVNIVMRGALRGARDVRVPAFLGIVILWLCVPTLTYVLGHVLGWGVLGAWCSFIVETALCAAVYSWRWWRGAWRSTYTASTPLVAPPAMLAV